MKSILFRCDNALLERIVSDNDRAIELGLIDVHGDILVNDELEDGLELDHHQGERAVKCNFKGVYYDHVLVSLDIDLTPILFLNDEQASVRKKLLDQKGKTHLIVKHNPNNPHDNKALEVYYQETFIGHIRKNYDQYLRHAKSLLEKFCFYRDTIEEIELIYDSTKFTLRKSATNIIKGIEQTQRLEKGEMFLLKIWEWALENEIDTIPFRKKEALELTFLRFGKEPEPTLGFNPDSMPVKYKITRPLPREVFNLPKLNAISFEGLGLTSLPSEIGNLVNLDILWLNRNNLSNLPSSMGKLSNLETIYLDDNKFTTFPELLLSLPQIESIDLSYNRLTSIPSKIGNLTSLKSLGLSNNQLTRLPDEIGSLVNLEEIFLNNNNLTYLPQTLRNLSNDVDHFYIHSNAEKLKWPGEKDDGIGCAIVFWVVVFITAVLVSS